MKMGERRQAILIMTDTTRKDMLGCYGNPAMKTPNIDRLALGGIRYNRAYTCQPVCGPARSAIFTGLSPHSNGIVTNGVPLGANVKTIGQRLTDHGISCGYVGKWHLDGGDYFGLGTCPEGWNPKYWYDMRCYLEELSEKERIRSRDPTTAYENMEETFTYAHRCSSRAIDFLREYEDQDFFLTVSYDEPHGPSLCPKPFNTMYDGYCFPCRNPGALDGLEGKPMMQRLWRGRPPETDEGQALPASRTLSQFLGCNSYVDYEIGRVLDEIDRRMPGALVIFTSDHGDMLGSHGLFSKNSTVYEEAAGIPLIIRGGAAGKTVDDPASHIDIAPTLLDYFNLGIPKLLEGKSMLAQIADPGIRINQEVFTEFTRYEVDHDGFGGFQPLRAIITERYKLAIHLLDTDEFYDDREDPGEIHNLIHDERVGAIRNALHDRLLEHMNETRDLYRGYQWAAREWRPDKVCTWENEGYTRQREDDGYEPRQLDYDTGLPMESAVRKKVLT